MRRAVDVHRTGRTRDGRPARPLAVGWWFDAVLVAAFAGLTVALVRWAALLRLDLATRDWVDAHRPPPARALGLVLDHLGQGGYLIAVTLAVAFVLAWRRRTVRPILPAGAAPIVVTVAIVAQALDPARRAALRPRAAVQRRRLRRVPVGARAERRRHFGVLALLLAPYLPDAARRVLCWVPGPLVFVGTTFLAYHWLTDSIGGYLLGLFVLRQLARVPWDTLPLPSPLDPGPAARARCTRRAAG